MVLGSFLLIQGAAEISKTSEVLCFGIRVIVFSSSPSNLSRLVNMITRCCLRASSCHVSALLSKLPSCQSIKVSLPISMETLQSPLSDDLSNVFTNLRAPRCLQWPQMRHFSSARDNGKDENDDGDEFDDEDYDDAGENDESGESSSDEGVSESVSGIKREYSEEEKASESAAIGYKVIGPLGRSERVFKSYEPVFAVVQVGSHQFKVSNGDCIFTERLKFCEVNDKIILNKVLLLASSSQTIVGRPIVSDGMVHAIVEEHALDAKVIIFKKKRRKNYRRTKGHRQELTKLRIIDIQGIEKPEKIEPEKPLKNVVHREEDTAVAA